MSGDVQPRKRKDKKRRKEEGEQLPTQTHVPLSTNTSNDDVNIHVHKEGGTGGGICAKLVFFVLFSALIVVIGMIITEYRGLSDVETVDKKSRFSQLFEGWTDAGPDHHDDHNVEKVLKEHEEEEDYVDNALDDENDEHELSEEEDEDNTDESEASEENSEEEDEEDAQTLEESEENQDSEDDEDVDASEDEEEKDTYEESESEEQDEEDHDEDEQELENINSDEENDDEEDEDDNSKSADEEDEASTENKAEEHDEEDEDDDAVDEGEDEDDADQSGEKVHVTPQKVKTRDVVDEKAPLDEKQQESSGMAVKLGVGGFLLVVAHLVLVRKWRSAPEPKPIKEEPNEALPNLSRRNTIVVPPTFNEVEADIEPEEEDFSDEELSEEETREPKSKTKYQELRSTYTRSLTPEGEIDYHKPESYEDEYEENVEDEEDEEISEEEEEDDEGGESDNEDYDEDEDEDEELLKRLEAKYGKLQEAKNKGATIGEPEDSDSDKQSDEGAGYKYSSITSKEDAKIKGEIDEAQKAVQNNSAYAIKLFDKILQIYPSSPRSIYGKALALDYLADQRRSNSILEQALKLYIELFNTENVPHALFEMAAERCINRMRFVGQYSNAINVHKRLINRFPNNPKYLNDLAVTYLTINRVEAARSVLKQVLSKWPNDGFALVHYGFILKTADDNLNEAISYLKRGLETKDEGVVDGRFYFHLGDALARLGKHGKAMEIYEEGVRNNVFLSKYQRSLYNVPRLTGKPWWEQEDLPYSDLFRLLRQNWQKIKEEGLAVLNEKGYFQDESENLRDTGEWKQFELFARGQKNIRNCKKCPFTCSIIEKIPEARNCKRGQTKFSVIHPGTHVWPHCGPTNCRLRAHLGLKVPPKTFIRVAEETRSWSEGEIFVFDDSFEHEVWHNGTGFRLVIIVDVWHPELTATEKRNLSPI